jgi:hypothetical protein
LFWHKTTISTDTAAIFADMERRNMWGLIIAVFLLAAAECAAQSDEGMEAIVTFLGADSPEDVDDEDAERLAHYIARPLKLNQASMPRIVDSGLLDRYRAASLHDYIQRHGEVLSLAELALIDGFSDAFVKRLAPFISLESSSLPGESPDAEGHLRGDLALKAGAKHNEGMFWTTALKARLEAGDGLSAALAFTSPYGRFDAENMTYSASVLWRCRKLHTDFILGDFNARFGQGLVLWNGLSLSSLSSPSAIMKNPTGLSQTSSFTGNYAFTGAGVETSIKSLAVSAFVAFPGIKTTFRNVKVMPALNLSYYWRYGQVAATYVSGKVSIDTRMCIRGVDVFAETVYDCLNRVPAGLCGTVFPAGEHLRMAAMLRYYPVSLNADHSGAICSNTSARNEYGTTFTLEYNLMDRHRVLAAIDAAHFPEPKKGDRGESLQGKCMLQWEWHALSWILVKARCAGRYRTWGDAFRTDVRADVQTQLGEFRVNLRLNALKCRGWGGLTYLEGGYEAGRILLWVRQGFFHIDDWNDRIYAYERGAPGGFRVPAYYGRGLWTAVAASVRFRQAGRLYFRAAYTGYPFPQVKEKPGKAELELQYVYDF